MKTYDITLIEGDGIGPEIAVAVKNCLDATGVSFNWDIQQAGIDIYEQEGTPLPQRVLDSISRNKLAIKAPITTPIGKGFRSVNVALRKEFDLYACLRPCKSFSGVRSRYTNVDLVLVRENTEDLYAGIEYEKGTPECSEMISQISKLSHVDLKEDTSISIKPISVEKTERVVRFAFDYAQKNSRKKVTAVSKANIMKFTDGLFFDVAEQVSKDYPDIEFSTVLIDALCMQLVLNPSLYDVLVLPNLYGDIVSDLGAGLVGGLGVAPGANIGTDCAIFEATHGSAPKYKGQNRMNPTALLLSGVMMLRYIDEPLAAQRLETAIANVIHKGQTVTYDLKPDRNDPTAAKTDEMAKAIIDEMKSLS